MADETPKFDSKNVANWRKEVRAAKGEIREIRDLSAVLIQ